MTILLIAKPLTRGVVETYDSRRNPLNTTALDRITLDHGFSAEQRAPLERAYQPQGYVSDSEIYAEALYAEALEEEA